jgi:type II secretory pathway pseudopilin PulG
MGRLKRQEGFTLIETIIFIVLIGVIAGLFYIPFSNALSSSDRSEVIHSAYFLLNQRMEELIRWNDQGQYHLIDENALTALPPLPSSYDGYSQQITALEVQKDNFANSFPGSGYKLVTISITHSRLFGSGQSITFLLTKHNH